ncbi:hypothetical protein J1N35_018776 [Gossypium stocksii]|uniref:Uncharacterized protein n=1 Tax=Gossypium stocksii TaxID=47602 RepID=A0A9D3VQ94_9ROSI|nr:hypothetical protein J1N35_018776 [Gossypium stocksii]
MANSLSDSGGDETRSSEDLHTKKVRFKEVYGSADSSKEDVRSIGRSNEDLVLFKGNVTRSTVNGISTIEFSDHIKQILFKEMETKNIVDYDRVLTQGPYVIYGQYLTVQPWTKYFSPLQPLSGLPGFTYKRMILEAIGGMVGKVAKLDFKMDSKARGRFARMAVFINLYRPLVSQVSVNEKFNEWNMELFR